MYVCVHLRAAALRQAHLQVATKFRLVLPTCRRHYSSLRKVFVLIEINAAYLLSNTHTHTHKP